MQKPEIPANSLSAWPPATEVRGCRLQLDGRDRIREAIDLRDRRDAAASGAHRLPLPDWSGTTIDPQHFSAMLSKPSSARRQRSSRRRVRHSAIPARLLVPHAPSIKCTIVALSTEGACLALGAAPRLPIILRMRAAGSVYRVQVAERGVGYVFVRFRSEQSRRRAT